MSRLTLSILILITSLSSSLVASDVESIKNSVLSKQRERAAGIKSYVVAQTMMGRPAVLFFEAAADQDGNYLSFRQVPMSECMRRVEALQGGMTPEQKRDFFEGYAAGLEVIDEAHQQEAGMSPFDFMGPGMGMHEQMTFLDAAANTDKQIEAEKKESEANWKQSNKDMETFWNTAKLLGTKTINGRKAYHLQSKGAGAMSSGKGAEFTPEVANMWIDTKEFVTLKFTVEGTVKMDGQTRPMSIEMESSDFKKVGTLFEPFKQVMRMGGMLNAQQKKELEEAKKQMAEFEKQMAAMPKAQQDMMKRMMGPQIEMMKKMVSSGGIEMETIIHKIKIGDISVYEEMMQWATQELFVK